MHTHTPSNSCFCQPFRKQHYYYSASPRVLADRHLHCSLFKAGGVCDCCCHQAEDMLLYHVKCCLWDAMCQLSFHPVFVAHLPASVFFFLIAPSQSTYTMSLLTCCPFSHTATCHWKESITPSAHSQEEV